MGAALGRPMAAQASSDAGQPRRPILASTSAKLGSENASLTSAEPTPQGGAHGQGLVPAAPAVCGARDRHGVVAL